MGFEVDDRKLKRAGLDYWHLLDITYYENVDDFFGRTAGPYVFFTGMAGKLYTERSYPPGAFLVFGREDAGVDWEMELLGRYPQSLARIPMIEEARCLNLSNAVAVAVYEALRCQGFTGLKK